LVDAYVRYVTAQSKYWLRKVDKGIDEEDFFYHEEVPLGE